MSDDRRRYVRLNKIFPVELTIVDLNNNPLSDLLQGFTRDVSFDGLCVEINDFDESFLKALVANQAKVVLNLNLPLKRMAVKAVANLAWEKKTAAPYPRSYLLGLSYEAIDKKAQRNIIRFATAGRILPRIAIGIFILLLFLCGLLVYDNVRLNRSNKLLVQELSQISDEQFAIQNELDKIETEKRILNKMLVTSFSQKQEFDVELAKIDKERITEENHENTEEFSRLLSERQDLRSRLAKLNREKDIMQEKLKTFKSKEKSLKTKLKQINVKKIVLQDKGLALMHQWLFWAQSQKTGLVLSYDNDFALMDVGFTYDQALSAFNLMHLQEFEKAKRIFNFYSTRAEKVQGGFANAYDIINGKVSEYIVHSGPCIYLGMAMLKYETITKDKAYRKTVLEIADWLLTLQERLNDGALPGGPEIDWAGTEQNLAGYIFFKNLYSITGLKKYDIAKRRIYDWLIDHAYDRKLKRFNRGANDRMIATDALALSIIALGPEGLLEMRIDPEDLIKCAEENCKTIVKVKNAFGKNINVTGFDFSAPSSVGRTGVISVEWTGQMVIALGRLSSYYKTKGNTNKADYYERKANYYLGEIEKLILVRNAFGANKPKAGFPYATSAGADTGHGWHTPQNNSISAAGTNFAIFAKEEYNIFGI